MLKILILSVLLYYVFRLVARILTFPSRINHERGNSRVFVYRSGEPNTSASPKEKDVSDSARILKD